jgi:ubiquinone/menaquinone biosynthesis C-methylase UbiE
MSEFSRVLIERSGYETEGFPDVYNRYRPSPPAALLDILVRMAGTERPDRVVDLGAGTGLSTNVWSSRANEVVGFEANPAMVERARQNSASTNVSYAQGFAAETGLADGTVDIVTCAQAFHWMEPTSVLGEAARILRPGGVFAAYDYDMPPVVLPELDAAFATHFEARRSARERLGLEAGAAKWPKGGHLKQIEQSRQFRFARELVCHGLEQADAERIVGLAESVGGPSAMFHGEAPEVGETFEALREVALRLLGERKHPMLVCYRVRVGVK